MVVNGDGEYFVGIAYDSLTDKIYWFAELGNGTWSICRANRNGTRLDRTLLTSKCTLLTLLFLANPLSPWILEHLMYRFT